jgi:hypothetical protein
VQKFCHRITIGKKTLQDRSKDVKKKRVVGVKASGLRQGKIHLLLINLLAISLFLLLLLLF